MNTFTRNTLVSCFTTGLDFIVLTSLVELFHVNYVVAVFSGTVVGALSNFFINRHWSFEVGHVAGHWQLARFVPVQAGSSALHTVGVWLLTEHTRLTYFGSKAIVAVAVYLIWNYPMNRFFVFRLWIKPDSPP
jgi:putative flippase GtrA